MAVCIRFSPKSRFHPMFAVPAISAELHASFANAVEMYTALYRNCSCRILEDYSFLSALPHNHAHHSINDARRATRFDSAIPSLHSSANRGITVIFTGVLPPQSNSNCATREPSGPPISVILLSRFHLIMTVCGNIRLVNGVAALPVAEDNLAAARLSRHSAYIR